VEAPLTVEGVSPPGGPRAPALIGETGRSVKGDFRAAYELYNGRYSFGPPISEAFVRAEDRRVVQYFTGAVLAYYPEAAEQPGFAELLPEQQVTLLIRPLNIGQQHLAARALPATPREVDAEFGALYRALGGRWRFGAALTEKLVEPAGDTPTVVQYFQHGSLLRNPVTGAIEPGGLGAWAWERQCAAVR
jgi:hypothetical protein